MPEVLTGESWAEAVARPLLLGPLGSMKFAMGFMFLVKLELKCLVESSACKNVTIWDVGLRRWAIANLVVVVVTACRTVVVWLVVDLIVDPVVVEAS